MPEFQNDPEHDAWKKGVMSGAIQLEEIDTEAFKDRYGNWSALRRQQKSSRPDDDFMSSRNFTFRAEKIRCSPIGH
jgi:hypothetical protein